MQTVDHRKSMLLAAIAGSCHRTARDYLLGREPRGHFLRRRLADACSQLGLERLSPVNNQPKTAA